MLDKMEISKLVSTAKLILKKVEKDMKELRKKERLEREQKELEEKKEE